MRAEHSVIRTEHGVLHGQQFPGFMLGCNSIDGYDIENPKIDEVGTPPSDFETNPPHSVLLKSGFNSFVFNLNI